MKKFLLLITIAIIGVVLWTVFSIRSSYVNKSAQFADSTARTERQEVDSPLASSQSSSKSNSRIRKVSLQDVREMGFAITADKYTEYGATGNVRLVSPNGDSATGRRLILSSSDNRFYLRGDVKVEVVKKVKLLLD